MSFELADETDVTAKPDGYTAFYAEDHADCLVLCIKVLCPGPYYLVPVLALYFHPFLACVLTQAKQMKYFQRRSEYTKYA